MIIVVIHPPPNFFAVIPAIIVLKNPFMMLVISYLTNILMKIK